MKLYIAGPITGYADGNRTAFAEAAEILSVVGYEVANPRELPQPEYRTFTGEPAFNAWADWMRDTIKMMMDCHAVALLDDWHRSKGACVEFDLAIRLGMQAEPWQYWRDERMVAK